MAKVLLFKKRRREACGNKKIFMSLVSVRTGTQIFQQYKEESSSFLKKTKKRFIAVADLSPPTTSRNKSFLVLFSKKEQSFLFISLT
jgi:hypothetical protein